MYKVVVSLTTNPNRLLNIEPVIQHLLAQDYEIFQIELNLPDLYKTFDFTSLDNTKYASLIIDLSNNFDLAASTEFEFD
jgi:hypothetical protein